MKLNIKTLKRIFVGLIALFLAVFVIRAIYELATFNDFETTDIYGAYYSNSAPMTQQQRNFASLKMEYQVDGTSGAAVLDQKYERVANITSKTVNFDNDIEKFDGAVKKQKAVIQTENRRGLKGSRRVDFIIGVRPEYFDALQLELSEIGRITSSNITKTDKTYEYRQMLAEKETLEKRRESYTDLKKLGGTIPDMLLLEEKIIEVETQIQWQQVSLGDYSDDNALCTINFSMQEGSDVGFLRKIWNALRWTTMFYFSALGVLLATALGAVVLAACWNFIKRVFGGGGSGGSGSEGGGKTRGAGSEGAKKSNGAGSEGDAPGASISAGASVSGGGSGASRLAASGGRGAEAGGGFANEDINGENISEIDESDIYGDELSNEAKDDLGGEK